ncbi:hypothetical protein Tco_0301294 [Tanacetum coccineum]
MSITLIYLVLQVITFLESRNKAKPYLFSKNHQDLWWETNTDSLVKKQEKVHLGIKVGANITVTRVPGQEGAKGNVAEKKKVKESMKANLRKLLKYTAWNILKQRLGEKCTVTPPDGAWTEHVSGGVTLFDHLKYKA